MMAHDHQHGHTHDHPHGRLRDHPHDHDGASDAASDAASNVAQHRRRGRTHTHAETGVHNHTHNHAHGDHLHSHMHAGDDAAEMQVLSAQFIDGFREARDKMSYLRLAGVPLERTDGDGPALKLVDVHLSTEWQVGTASPSFGSRELSYLPFPGEMVTERTNMGFVYVSTDRKAVMDLRDFLKTRAEGGDFA